MKPAGGVQLAAESPIHSSRLPLLRLQAGTNAEAVQCIVHTLLSAHASGNMPVLCATVRALLSLSGCLNCRCYYDK